MSRHRDTFAMKAYRFADAAPWLVLMLHGWLHHEPWLAFAGWIGIGRRLFVGWEYPLPSIDELLRRDKEATTPTP